MTRILRYSLPLCLGIAACAMPPKPRELDTFEQLRQQPIVAAAQKRDPQLVAAADQLLNKAKEEYEDKDLDESRRDALMGDIKLKTAITLVEQDQAHARIAATNAKLAEATDQYGRLAKELTADTEQIALLQKLQEARSSAAAEKQQLSAEQQRTAAQTKIAEAELALRTADTVDAQTYAKTEYQAAADLLQRAKAELGANNPSAALQSAELSQSKAQLAVTAAKPAFDQAQQSKSATARNEALARDAAAIPGTTVRLERQGDVQRLVLPIHGFVRHATLVNPSQQPVLDAVAALLKKYPTYQVQLIGHTDNRGHHDRLVALSQARAQSVYSALLARGVDAKRFVVSGQGSDQPVTDNRTRAGRAQNNRVEVVFIYQ